MRRALLLIALATAGCIEAPSEADGGDDPDAAAVGDAGEPENQLLVNAGFEAGIGVGWVYQPGGAPRIATATDLGVPPQGGEWAAEVGGSDNTNEVISQSVDIPDGVTGLTLSFYRCILSDEDKPEAFDYCNVRASVGDEPVTLLQESNDMSTATCEWEEAVVAVTPFTAGAPLDLLLIANNDSSAATSCFYDSFELIPTFE